MLASSNYRPVALLGVLLLSHHVRGFLLLLYRVLLLAAGALFSSRDSRHVLLKYPLIKRNLS